MTSVVPFVVVPLGSATMQFVKWQDIHVCDITIRISIPMFTIVYLRPNLSSNRFSFKYIADVSACIV